MRLNRGKRLSEVLRRRFADLTILMELRNPRNVGAILRTADAVGINIVHWCKPGDFRGDQTYDPATRMNSLPLDSKELRATSKGSNRWVLVRDHTSAEEAVTMLKKDQGMQIIAAHLSEDSVDYRDVDYTNPTCIILGAEARGVSPEALTLADKKVKIPMRGMADSLNVSNASSVILFEAQRQRVVDGPSESSKLTEGEIQRILVEMLQPEIARYCVKRGMRYPLLDEEGEIDDEEWYRMHRGY